MNTDAKKTEQTICGLWDLLDAERADNKRLRAQVAALTEQNAKLTEELAESDAIRDKCAHLLAETAVALKGPEKALHRHGWQDLPEAAAKTVAALLKAREGLVRYVPHSSFKAFKENGRWFVHVADDVRDVPEHAAGLDALAAIDEAICEKGGAS